MARPVRDTVGARYIADRTGYTQRTIYHWANAGYIPGTTFTPDGKVERYQWKRRDINQWIKNKFR